ncbi:oxidoreductase [Phaeosphaeriaceae sp. PMI808]|nr:oxidoreductase [Phaeosphaeriaceae sp. PMI808]
MAPIRVGIIGLSSVTDNVSASPGDGWAASAHLPYLTKSPHYEITALCNSTVKSAQAAIERHGLPSSTKAYGNPEDIANDPNVDLVVCCVRVDRHYQLMMPSLKAGKAAFVEWPLGSNLQQAEEMLATANKSGSKTIVGLQSRPSPIYQKVKELVEAKAIGELISSNISYSMGYPGDANPPGVDYMAKKEVGGNFFTIMFGHTADAMWYALGGLHDLSAQLSTRWEDTKLLHSDGSFYKIIKRETPDHVVLHGTVGKTGAPISMFSRAGKSYPNVSPLVWHVFGTKGEIRVTSNTPIALGLGGEKIELFDHETDTVKEISVQYRKEVEDLAPFAKNIGALYELYAEGGTFDQGFVDFEQAVRMHKILDKMEKSSEGRKWETMSD